MDETWRFNLELGEDEKVKLTCPVHSASKCVVNLVPFQQRTTTFHQMGHCSKLLQGMPRLSLLSCGMYLCTCISVPGLRVGKNAPTLFLSFLVMRLSLRCLSSLKMHKPLVQQYYDCTSSMLLLSF
ncbi:hypothetical protein ACFX2I_000471 [Malus domestica]